MDLPAFLNYRGITLDDVTSQARAAIDLTPDELFLICGSVVEGLANEKSDLDIFLITPRDDIRCTSDGAIMLIVGQCPVDIRVVQRARLEELLYRFNSWAEQPRQVRNAIAFTYEERKLLHRLRTGQALWGSEHVENLQKRIKSTDLIRHRLDCARYHANAIQVDLAGLRSSGDQWSMLFAAQELLGHTVDALLAGHGHSNCMLKWRVRQLASLPAEWEVDLPGRRSGMSALDLYVSLHSAPQDPNASTILDHALRIVAFSRRVFPWAECRLLDPGSLRLSCARSICLATGRLLPNLDLDVTVRYRDGKFELLRLNGSGEIFCLSPQEYSLLCLFDGETPAEYATCEAETLCEDESGSNFLEQISALVQHGVLEARPLLDEKALKNILRALDSHATI